MVPTYFPEALTDFSQESNRALMYAALDAVTAQLGRRYPLVIGDEHIETDETVPSLNPSDWDGEPGPRS